VVTETAMVPVAETAETVLAIHLVETRAMTPEMVTQMALMEAAMEMVMEMAQVLGLVTVAVMALVLVALVVLVLLAVVLVVRDPVLGQAELEAQVADRDRLAAEMEAQVLVAAMVDLTEAQRQTVSHGKPGAKLASRAPKG